MYEEKCVEKPKNRYFDLIEKCKCNVGDIRAKVNIIINTQVKDGKPCEPCETSLEKELRNLLEMIIDLKNDIID